MLLASEKWISPPSLRIRSSYLNSLETYRFKEEDEYEYKIWLDVFSRILKIKTSRKASFYLFSLEKLALLPLVKEVTPSPDRKMIKLLTFDNLFSHFDILAKTRVRVTTATTFSRQNDAGHAQALLSTTEKISYSLSFSS